MNFFKEKSLTCNLKLLSLRLDSRCSNYNKRVKALTYEISNSICKANYSDAGRQATELIMIDSLVESYGALSHLSNRLGVIFNMNADMIQDQDRKNEELRDICATFMYFNNHDSIKELKEIVKILYKKLDKDLLKELEVSHDTYVMPKVKRALTAAQYPEPKVINKYLSAIAQLNNIVYNDEYLKFIEHHSVTIDLSPNANPEIHNVKVETLPTPVEVCNNAEVSTVVNTKPQESASDSAAPPVITSISAENKRDNSSIQELERRINLLKKS